MRSGPRIDDYMVNAEQSLRQLDGTGYELLDTEVRIYDGIGIVVLHRSL